MLHIGLRVTGGPGTGRERDVPADAAADPLRHGGPQLGLGFGSGAGDMADGGPDVLHAVGVATVLGGVHAEQQGKSSGGGRLDGRKRRRRHDDRGAGLRGRTGNQRDRPEAEEAGSLVVGGHPALFESGEEEVERVGEAVLEPGQAGSEHLEVDPRSAPPDPEGETAPGEVVEEGRLLGQRHRMAVGEHAHRGPDRDPACAAEDVGGEGDGRGAHAVGDEVVLGDPDAVQAGPFGGDGGVRGSGQRLALGHARELPGEQEDAELHRPMCRCRSAGLSSPGGRATD